jgi:hypothetical protein
MVGGGSRVTRAIVGNSVLYPFNNPIGGFMAWLSNVYRWSLTK